jgi:hypothetical protein
MSTARTLATKDFGEPLDQFLGARCRQTVWMPRPSVLVIEQSGHLDADLARALQKVTAHAIALGRLPIGFVDARNVTGYTPEHRQLMTTWIRSSMAALGGMHVLTHSKLVSMGIAVANLALDGSIRSHATQATFDAAYREALERPRS